MDSSLFAGLDAAIEKVPENYKAGAVKNREIFEKYLPMVDEDIWKLSLILMTKLFNRTTRKQKKGNLCKGSGYLPLQA